ncbi:MAG TPA: hypothetical protein VLU95_06800 [Candidatus Acidoferrum sp.]|nr:hypothetical protein [Candidatus Acidoferrum sp.]
MVDSNRAKAESPKLEESIVKLKEILLGLQRNLSILHQTIENIESRPELLDNLELFEKDAESRASNLEAEVKQLREQLEIVKEILGLNTKKTPVEY